MAHCAHDGCGRWRPTMLADSGRVGIRFDDAWYCSVSCLHASTQVRLEHATVVESPNTRRIASRARLGAILLHQGSVTRERLQIALDRQARLSLRVGQALTVLGLASTTDVLRALAAQAQVAFLSAIDVGRVEDAPGNFSSEAVRALGVVPFEMDEEKKRVKVACQAPLPRSVLTALREISGWAVEPYLVWDTEWTSLVSAYGRAKRRGPRQRPVLKSASDAATRITRSAVEGRAAGMAWVRCAPFVWVRLHGAENQDLFVPIGSPREGSRVWPAAPMSH